MIQQGRHIFRFATFADQTFWGGKLKLHETINVLTPRQALALGLKIDSEHLPAAVIQAIQNGTVNLDDPTVTRLLIKLNARWRTHLQHPSRSQKRESCLFLHPHKIILPRPLARREASKSSEPPFSFRPRF
jgi:hypothetical protein